MVQIDFYASTGFALELLANSRYHRQQCVDLYFKTEILPALQHNQAWFNITSAGVPTAMITWAWLNDDVRNEVHQTGRTLKYREWICGKHLFLNDWITPYGNIREVKHNLFYDVFKNVDTASSIRRNIDGSVRRVNRWRRSKRKQIDEYLGITVTT